MKKAHFREKQRLERNIADVRQQTAAATAARTGDSFQNLASRTGNGAGNLTDANRYNFNFTSRNRILLEAAYRSSWICGLAVDLVAKDMTRAGIEFQSDDLTPDDSQKLHEGMEQLRIWDKLCATLKWARLYGGALAVMLIDGQNTETPLKIDTVKLGQFKGLLVLDRWQVMPTLENLVEDFGPDLGQPKFYDVQVNADALRGKRVHYSRVIRIDGLDLPYQQRITENGWGQSVLERLWDRITAFDSTTDGIAQLVYKAHLRTIKIAGLREIVAGGGKALQGLEAQVDFMRRMQSNEGITMMDGKDEFEAHSYTFAGLDDVLLQFGQQISGATQIPLTRLFGQSPAGMNATGESDLINYYDGVNADQNATLRHPIGQRLMPVMARSMLGRDLPPGFNFEFASLWQMTNEQKAVVTKSVTEAITSAESGGLISPRVALKELRQLSRTTGVFTHISDEDIEKADEDPPEPIENTGLDANGQPITPTPGAQENDDKTSG